ncbi:MAG: hypothetical protein HQL86_06940 [Magnetococcales bacterium]|nr:hypothetical protein [Magnetococcales bacterium]
MGDASGVILALDLATKTGWATGQRGLGVVASGTQSFVQRRYDGGGMLYLRFRKWLDDMSRLVTIREIHYEEVRRHMGVDAAHVYGGIMATLTSWCEEHEIPYRATPVATIKKHATGKGNASKGDVIAAMQAKGHTPGDDNEADALALLYCVLDER